MENKGILPARFGYSWIENSKAARGAKIWKYTVVMTNVFTMSENIFSELRTGHWISNLKFN